MPDIRNYALIALAILCGVLGLSTWQYKRMYKATDFALTTQNAAIEANNKEAKRQYDILKGERDQLQEWKNQHAAALEKQGENAKSQIADDSIRDTAPVVVRYISRDARGCGNGASGGGTAAAKLGDGNANVSSGVLAPEVEKLIKRDADDIERLQAAFNLCAQKVTQ